LQESKELAAGASQREEQGSVAIARLMTMASTAGVGCPGNRLCQQKLIP